VEPADLPTPHKYIVNVFKQWSIFYVLACTSWVSVRKITMSVDEAETTHAKELRIKMTCESAQYHFYLEQYTVFKTTT